MSKPGQDWPTISISEADQELVKKFSGPGGLLEDADVKNVLMIAAAMAVEFDLPEVPGDKKQGKKKDVIHQSLLRSDEYNEYRQYMLLIYFLTAGKQDLRTMDNFKEVAANFVELAHRGLEYLKLEYVSKPDGKEEIEHIFGEYLGKRKKVIAN